MRIFKTGLEILHWIYQHSITQEKYSTIEEIMTALQQLAHCDIKRCTIIGVKSDAMDGSTDVVIFGYGNRVSGKRNIVLGNNNIVEGDDNIVIGNDQYIVGNNHKFIKSDTTTDNELITYFAETAKSTIGQLLKAQYGTELV